MSFTIKFLEENTGKTFSDINHSNVFLGQSPKAIEIKTKIYKWELIKLKNFCTAKGTINNTRTAHTTQEQKNNPSEKWAEYLNRHFNKEDIKYPLGTMKRCSTLLIIRKL